MKSIANRLYLDCDGVLANFNDGFAHVFGRQPDRDSPTMPPQEMWDKLRDTKNFYTDLQKMPDADELFAAVEHLRPIILTGTPLGDWAAPQKLKWRDQHFPGVPMVTCFSKDKYRYCVPGDVLVDDLEKARHPWLNAGGEFVHHTSAKHTITRLRGMQEWLA